MKRYSVAVARLVALMACAGLMLLMTASAQAKAIAVGNGLSLSKDAKAAGAEAAKKAKDALGDEQAKAVLVFHSQALAKGYEQVLEGVASVFDSSLIYGCGAYATLTQDGNDGHLAVLAIGGDVQVTAAVAQTAGKQDDEACGKRIGDALKHPAAKGPGKVLILFGDCHVPRDNQLVKGVCGVLGETFPVVGAAALNGDIYVKGEKVKKSNVGLLLTGNFTCGFGMKKDMSPEGLINSARDTFKDAIGDKKKVACVLVFDCGGRRGAMQKNKNFAKELEAMKEVAGDTPIFGFYGSGEIGCPATGAPPKGDGYHISACAIALE